ncbi:MAG: aminotransferase [Planctomycetota bacterium]|nr:MAG: aminotransferase [Planctomycetota bacterium]
MLPDPNEIDPGGLLEYSVVFSDHSLNHMSQRFRTVMRELCAGLREVYGAEAGLLVPGGGTFAMEAVARQLAQGERVLILRNGWFSYRWSQILERAAIAEQCSVLTARQLADEPQAPWEPPAIDELCERIASEKPALVFAPHVETSAGMQLPDEYLRRTAAAVHAVGGLFVLDCIASGTYWLDMSELGIDVLITAPQKGWSASPCAGVVMLSRQALERVRRTTSSSFTCDLRKWLEIMQAYQEGGHAYHATMPTDALCVFHQAMGEMRDFGLDKAKDVQLRMGRELRELLQASGFPSVAAPGYESSGIVVSYSDDPERQSGAKFGAAGLQIAGGVPLMCGEREDFSSFRIGLFGLAKLRDPEGCLARLRAALTGN